MRTAEELLKKSEAYGHFRAYEEEAIALMEEYATDLKTENILLSAENEQLKGQVQMMVEQWNNRVIG